MSTKTVHERARIPIPLVSEFPVRATADQAVPRRHAASSSAALRAAFAQEVRPTARLRNY
jgi:hypothetical protein